MSDNSPMNVLLDPNAARLEDWLTGKTSTFVIDPTANRLEAPVPIHRPHIPPPRQVAKNL